MVFFVSSQGSNTPSFNDHVLLWPALTLGNIGQLCIDLIINTYGFERVGYIYDENIIPVVGNDTYTTNKGVMSTAVEVYQLASTKITIVQQRSPIIAGRYTKFSNNLYKWFNDSQFSQLLFISSTNANKRIDSQLSGNQLRYVISQSINNESLGKLKSLSIPEMETQGQIVIDGQVQLLSDRLTGLARDMKDLVSDKFLALVLFCSEGDNTADAINVARFVSQYIGLPSKDQFEIPSSWNLMQGPAVDQSLFF
ncbi:proteasome assembly chaperone 2 [Cavenderia fasciculata]|uniref:Proteasome assembly chaperone 2 n=1 Tax=Cavenderia fasciculata TaxID=261658 RepID=F4PIE3_CACFS|nr:proteasome assembly chaperone 2 [Cavenderia fasciculata]EGG25372.1 proteasome assembly chaperone 2 [Cavenderia fasciculata]|eukprot:XP_004363223.1 proteasome assembly chaperone 2 [Cavenderia fasciculata]